jgi:hypothetical protein
MKRHLSSEEISSWMIGERSVEVERHAVECPRCRAELDRVEDAFSRFRESGIRWADRCYAARYGEEAGAGMFAVPAVSRRVAQRRGLLMLWRAGAVAASVFAGVVLMLRPAPPPEQAQAPVRRGQMGSSRSLM